MNSYFEGWYFKQQNARDTLILIPAVYCDSDGNRGACLQIVTDDKAYMVEPEESKCFFDRRRFAGYMAGSTFHSGGVSLDVQNDEVTANGRLRFGPLSPPRGEVMGPFSHIPFLQCRHSIMSMSHTVSGCIVVNGKSYVFENGRGYIEGDRGNAFPGKYAWTQCSGAGASVSLAVAEVPLLCKSRLMTLGIVHFKGMEYRFASYLGARIARAEDGKLSIFQEGYILSAEFLDGRERALAAPSGNDMSRIIKESPSCIARYRLRRGKTVLFDFTSDRASFEWEKL